MGRTVAEGPVVARPADTVGYIVVEAGTWVLGDGRTLLAALGTDTVAGTGDSPPYTYAGLTGEVPVAVAASTAGVDGGNGGWPVLWGALSPGLIPLAVEEDTRGDSERNHTAEQLGVLAIYAE